jgi:hypothetical protein
MSSHPRFHALPEAVAMYLSGQCRRWAIVDGHLVDLHHAAHPVEVSRPAYNEPKLLAAYALAESGARGELPILEAPSVSAEAPAVECCRTCGRPLIGEVP